MEMKVHLTRSRKVEGGTIFKIWRRTRLPPYSCETTIVVVEGLSKGL